MGLILSGAMAGGGAALQQAGMQLSKQWGAEELEKMREDAATARQAALIEAQKLMETGRQAHDVNLVGVREKSRREGAMYDVENIDPIKNRNALILARGTAQAKIDIETSPENIEKKIAAAKQLGPVEAEIKLNAEMAQLAAKSTPDALRSLHAIAKATQVLTPGQVAEGQIKQLELSKAKLMDTMQGAYSAAVEAGDADKANGIVQVMTARFFDPAKLKDNAELRAAQAVMVSMDSTPEQKAQAGDFIMKALASTASKLGGASGQKEPPAAAIQALQKDPRLANDFRAKYKVDPTVYLNAQDKPGATKQLPPDPRTGQVPGSVAQRMGLIGRGLTKPVPRTDDEDDPLNPN